MIVLPIINMLNSRSLNCCNCCTCEIPQCLLKPVMYHDGTVNIAIMDGGNLTQPCP